MEQDSEQDFTDLATKLTTGEWRVPLLNEAKLAY
jgi:hypothetical protein